MTNSQPITLSLNVILDELDRQLRAGELGLNPTTLEEALEELAGVIKGVYPDLPCPPVPVLLQIYHMLAQAVSDEGMGTGYTLMTDAGEIKEEVTVPKGVTLQ